MLKAARYRLRALGRALVRNRRADPRLVTPPSDASRAFAEAFARNLAACDWEPHPRHSVFTQYDRRFYTAMRAAYLRKYRSFWAVARTIAPRRILELGTHAGSGADAYLGGAPGAEYLGIDQFPQGIRDEITGAPWDPLAVAHALLGARGYRYRLLKTNLRALRELPERADFVVVDAAHDFDNEYADLRLALTAAPDWIFVDDAADRRNAGAALLQFLQRDLAGKVEFTVPIDYIEGGLVIRLKTRAA